MFCSTIVVFVSLRKKKYSMEGSKMTATHFFHCRMTMLWNTDRLMCMLSWWFEVVAQQVNQSEPSSSVLGPEYMYFFTNRRIFAVVSNNAQIWSERNNHQNENQYLLGV